MNSPIEFETDELLPAEWTPIRQPGHRPDSKTVLLVEDEPSVRALAKTFLQMDGYTVLEARDAIEALLVSDRHRGPINLLLTDVNMPRTNGHQLAEKLRREQPGLRSY
jgi:CheY-like chemotaxis protein